MAKESIAALDSPKDLSSKARYAYTWKEPGSPIKVPDKELHPLPELRVVKTPKHRFTITEQEDQTVIEFEDFIIKIQSK